MIRPNKTFSAVGSEQNKNIGFRQDTSQITEWYAAVYRNRNQYRKAATSIPAYKQSHPYCLNIHRMSSLAVNKKHSSSSLFINVSGFFATEEFQILGIPFTYQFQQGISRNDGRWEAPLCLFYHSKIDKNYEGFCLFLKLCVVEIKETIVENLNEIGTIVIRNPFIELERKVFPIFNQFNQADFGFMSAEAKQKMLVNTSTLTAQISIEAKFQLKKLSKLVSQNTIFTHQSPISGVKKGYIQRIEQVLEFKEASSFQVKINFLQIHISQKYQQDLIAYSKKIWPNQKITDVKSRKIVIGYHNEYTLVNGNHRKLQLLRKEVAGQQKILVYEALKQGQVLKIPYYFDDNHNIGILIAGVIYEVNGRQLQIATYYLIPAEKGQDISQNMVTGMGYGALYQLVAIPTTEKPTIIMQYQCDGKDTQSIQDTDRSRKDLHSKKWEDQQLVKEKQKLKEEIQKERLQILKEKQQMEKLKNQHYLNFQAQFQKKFEVEKQNLYRKQQLIENQYRQQVQRQIRERFTVEQQIKKMNDKLKNIEENNFKKPFQEDTYRNPLQAPMSSPRFSTPAQTLTAFPAQRQRIDPSYIIQPQNPVPVKKVRQILQKQPKLNSQIIKQSEQQFNFASKFTFYFTSMVWSQHVDPPKQIYLIIRFFNQEQFRTDNLTYLQGEENYYQLVRSSHLINGNQKQQPSYNFSMDPSDYSEPYHFQKDLVNYMLNNSAIIDVFCGETHLYIGQVKIKLKQLVRGHKTQTLIAKDLALVKLKDKNRVGTIQVMIKNQQMNCKNEVSLKFKKKMNDVKKKVVSNSPIFIKNGPTSIKTENIQNYRGEAIKKKSNNTTRQQLRIQKFKEQKAMKSFSQTTNGFSQLDDSEKGVVLTQIASYKEKKMQQYIKQVYEGLLSEQINLSAHYGKAVTFPFLFQNTSPFPASFKISFISTDSKEQELAVVKNSKQWRYLSSQHNYGEPKRYDIIGQNDIFFLHAGQSIPLVFKFLSFDSQSSNKDKIINVTICKQDNNWIAGGFSLLVQMHQPIVQHSYILYEPGDQMVDLIVPVVYSQTSNASKPHKLHLTDPSPASTAHWLTPYQILIRIKTPKIMDKLKFNLLLYNDEYFCDLSQNWLIEVHAYEGVSSYFRSDYNTKFKITLPWTAIPAYLGLLSLQKATSTLKLYSSSAALVFKNNQIKLDSDKRSEGGMQIWCELLGGQNSRKSFEITCVGGEDNELIYGWTVTVFPYMPRN